MMKTFYAALANTLAAFLTNTLVWCAVTFWVYLETKSVIATAIMAGVYSSTVALSGFFLGSLVDRYPKKNVMLLSSISSLVLYALACFIFVTTPRDVFADASSIHLWAFNVLALFGTIAGNSRGIALSTLVTILVPEGGRDKANGLLGTVGASGEWSSRGKASARVRYERSFWQMPLCGSFALSLHFKHPLCF